MIKKALNMKRGKTNVSRLTYKYRIYPTIKQEQMLHRMIAITRRMYNWMLAERKEYFDRTGHSLSDDKIDQRKPIATIRNENIDYFGVLPASAIGYLDIRLDETYSNFFRGLRENQNIGFPKPKSFKYWNSFRVKYIGGFSLKDRETSIRFDNLFTQKYFNDKKDYGFIKVRTHRKWPEHYKPKTVDLIVKRNSNKKIRDKFYITISLEFEKTIHELSYDKENCIGIDFGLKPHNLMTLSDGEFIQYPFSISKLEEEASKKKSRATRGSTLRHLSNRQKKKLQLANKLTEHISNKKKDFIHNLTRDLERKYNVIIIEDFKSKFVMEAEQGYIRKLAHQAAIAKLVETLEYKLGNRLIKVDPAYTSKMCSKCKNINRDFKTEEIYKCDKCGLIIDRDKNAALNIQQKGLDIMFNKDTI